MNTPPPSLGRLIERGGRYHNTRLLPARVHPRTPDFAVKPDPGVIYTGGTKIAEHGGFSDDDSHVALLVSYIGQRPHIVSQPVQTAQVAPTILEALGIAGRLLQAVRFERTRELPELRF